MYWLFFALILCLIFNGWKITLFVVIACIVIPLLCLIYDECKWTWGKRNKIKAIQKARKALKERREEREKERLKGQERQKQTEVETSILLEKTPQKRPRKKASPQKKTQEKETT